MLRTLRRVAFAVTIATASAPSAPALGQQCAGDCDFDFAVDVDELVVCMNIALGATLAQECEACDTGLDGEVTVEDLVAAVGSALGFSLQGTCRVPCQGAECELPEAAIDGLIPCPSGTVVSVSRCTDRATCLRDESGRTAPNMGLVQSSGAFTVRIDACRRSGELFLVEAALDQNGGGTYRTLVTFSPGNAAGVDRTGRLALIGGAVLDPSSEASVSLLDQLGLENFTDEGAIGVIEAIRTANQFTRYVDERPAAAADHAAEVAVSDPRVLDAFARGRVPTPTPTRTPPSGTVEIEIGSATTAPNSHVTIGVTLNQPLDALVVGTQNDIRFAAGARIAERAMPMGVLAEAASATDTAIVLDDATGVPSFGTLQIDDELVAYGEVRGNVLVVGGCRGGGAVTVCIEDTECSGGASCQPVGRGQGGTVPSAHEAGAGILLQRLPDCQMSHELESANKNAVFSFLPPGCDPEVDCDTVRASVIALDNLSLLPGGETLLYVCRVDVGSNEGTFPLTCEGAQASGLPDGPGLLPVTCFDGEVAVQEGVPTETPTATRTLTAATPTATPPTDSSVIIDVGSAFGRPGETVRLDVTLQVSNAAVAATDNRITVSPSTPLLGCEVPSEYDGLSAVTLEPHDCDDHPNLDCNAARVLVINRSFMPIENGALLYSCEVEIPPTTEPGIFPVVCSNQLAASPIGQPFNGMGRCEQSTPMSCETDGDCAKVGGACRHLPPTQCNSGSIMVSDGPPFTPTPTGGVPTPTPTPTATSSDALEIRIGSTALPANQTGTFDVTLHVGAGHEATGALHEILLPDGVTIPALMSTATFLSADIGPTDTAIAVDDVMALPVLGFVQIDEELIAYESREGDILAVGICSGGERLCADHAECDPQETCDPTGRGQNGTIPAQHAAGATVEIPTSVPDCVMSPALEALGKDAVFSVLPGGCSPGVDCDSIRAIVISLSDSSAFPTGDTVLYTCALRAGEEAGTFPLECANPQVSGPPDEGLLDASCSDGEVVVYSAVCGNGFLEEGEDCDDGSICLPSFEDCTDSGECPDGQRCEPVGGDGCARNCTSESIRVSSLDPETSDAVIQAGPGGLAVIRTFLSGQQVLRTGRARTDDTYGPNNTLLTRAGDVPLVVRADDTSLDPAPIGILACACLRPTVEPLFGPGLAAVGVIGCGETGPTNVSFLAEQDHNTTPGDPNNGGSENGLADDPSCEAMTDLGNGLVSRACLEGQDVECTTPLATHGVCNSPLLITYTGGQAPRGSILLHGDTTFTVLEDGGACDTTMAGANPCPYDDYGPDCIPCTLDDGAAETIVHNAVMGGTTAAETVIRTPVTSGTAAAIIYDNRNSLRDVNMITVGPGEPADCDAILGDPNAPVQGVVVSASQHLDKKFLGDVTVRTRFALE